MDNKYKEINLDVVAYFKRKFPGVKTNQPTWAQYGVTEQMRLMNIGDIVLFPINEYNYQTIRAAPATSLAPEMLNEGRKWSTTLDRGNKSVAVLRTA